MNKYIENTDSQYTIDSDGNVYHHSHLDIHGNVVEGEWLVPVDGQVKIFGVYENVQDLVNETFGVLWNYIP